jgi:uncharacterized protein
MEILPTADYITHTQKWIKEVVIGMQLCPFAAKVYNDNSIRYHVVLGNSAQHISSNFLEEINLIQSDQSIATSLLIYPHAFPVFEAYLTWVAQAERLLKKNKLNDTFQLASFHPDYIFAESHELDAANYTNRSAYPMIHILREAAVTEAIDSYPNIDDIPENNIELMQQKGLQFMKQLRHSCMG